MTTGAYARVVAAAVAGALLAPPAAARAQQLYGVPQLRNSSYLGVGYVASIPEAFVGFTVLALTPKVLGGAGLYADVKLTPTSPRDPYFDPNITVDQAQNQFGDFLVDQRSTWLTVNLAAVYAATPELAIYGGAGYSRERHYREYYDNSKTRGLFGFYWIADPAASGNRVNALGGLLLRAGEHILFQVGGESQPRGADVGVMFTLPLH